MAVVSADLTAEEFAAVDYVRDLFPKRWKVMIHQAWQTGDYSPITSRNGLIATLQQLRNTKGPGWLFNVKLPTKPPAFPRAS